MSQTGPRILIPVPTSFDAAYNEQSWPEYAAAVQATGGTPVRFSLGLSSAEMESSLEEMDGLLLPGSGADVNPERYGHPRNPATAAPDPAREQADFVLLAAAERLRLPVLTICYGTQSLNVFRGGTLIQDLTPAPVNHRAGRAVIAAHAVSILPSRLSRVLFTGDEDGGMPRPMVNSSHHQAISAVGAGLAIIARSPIDSVVEAVEASDPDVWLVGLQWHPERTMEHGSTSKAIFLSFVQAAAQHRS